MAYYFYFGKMLCPVAPSKLQLKINNQNKTYVLINDGEINVIKKPGLTEIEFDILLPNVQYPFATYKNGFQNAKYYLDIIESLKSGKKRFQFIVTRTFPNGKMLFDTNMKVSLEEYTIKEDAKEGFDVVVTVKLKQYRDYGTKTYKPKASARNHRSSDNSPAPKNKSKSYKVKKGDTLWAIAKKFYGDGAKYTVIVKANKSKIKNANLNGHVGQVLTIPVV